MDGCIDEIHDYWFGPLDASGFPTENRHPLWFQSKSETDAELARRFSNWLERGCSGELDHWRDSDRGLVALIVLLDQFSRNIHRGTARAFAADPGALTLAQDTITGGRHRQLPAIHRVFLYLPLEHSEELANQEESVRLFRELAKETGHAMTKSFTHYAIAHRDVIARFDRFPHRNALLGRKSSNEELEYLDKHGGF